MTVSELVIFGGTFDPPHLGHLAVMRGLRAALGEPLLVIPNGRPAHRRAPAASPDHRLRMTRIMVAELGDPEVSVSDLEATRPGPSYTADTLALLQASQPDRRLLLALGADAARGLPRWRRPLQVLELAALLVFDRPGSRVSARGAVQELTRGRLGLESARVLSLDAPQVEASRVRARLRGGRDCRELVPGVVLEYIRRHRLYSGAGRERPLPMG